MSLPRIVHVPQGLNFGAWARAIPTERLMSLPPTVQYLRVCVLRCRHGRTALLYPPRPESAANPLPIPVASLGHRGRHARGRSWCHRAMLSHLGDAIYRQLPTSNYPLPCSQHQCTIDTTLNHDALDEQISAWSTEFGPYKEQGTGGMVTVGDVIRVQGLGNPVSLPLSPLSGTWVQGSGFRV